MPMQTVAAAKRLAGKVALVRLDTNVPLRGRKVIDDSRLRESLPTLRLLERRGANLVLLGHLGRPSGRRPASLSLKPIGYALGKLLRRPVVVLPLERGGPAIRRAAHRQPVLLENLRFHNGEDKNEVAFAKKLVGLGDVYVNDAFSVSHRPAASIVGIAKFRRAYAGLALAAEVAALTRVRQPRRPAVAVIGGAKVEDKLPVIAKLLPKLSVVLVGGAVASTFLRAKGLAVGRSLVAARAVPTARALLKRAAKKIVLPVDVIVDRAGTRRRESWWRLVDAVGKRERIVDVGTRSTVLYAHYLKRAATVLWAGTLGLTEERPWSHGTLALGRFASARARGRTFVVVGGGDTAAFFHSHRLAVDHVSLGGSAMLEFLAGVHLPGLVALGYGS